MMIVFRHMRQETFHANASIHVGLLMHSGAVDGSACGKLRRYNLRHEEFGGTKLQCDVAHMLICIFDVTAKVSSLDSFLFNKFAGNQHLPFNFECVLFLRL